MTILLHKVDDVRWGCNSLWQTQECRCRRSQKQRAAVVRGEFQLTNHFGSKTASFVYAVVSSFSSRFFWSHTYYSLAETSARSPTLRTRTYLTPHVTF